MRLCGWKEQNLLDTKECFKWFCGLFVVVGITDDTHMYIAKTTHGPKYYFYFKSRRHTMHCQAVVDSRKWFLDLYPRMPNFTNDTNVLWSSSLNHFGMHNNLINVHYSIVGLVPTCCRGSWFSIENFATTTCSKAYSIESYRKKDAL